MSESWSAKLRMQFFFPSLSWPLISELMISSFVIEYLDKLKRKETIVKKKKAKPKSRPFAMRLGKVFFLVCHIAVMSGAPSKIKESVADLQRLIIECSECWRSTLKLGQRWDFACLPQMLLPVYTWGGGERERVSHGLFTCCTVADPGSPLNLELWPGPALAGCGRCRRTGLQVESGTTLQEILTLFSLFR